PGRMGRFVISAKLSSSFQTTRPGMSPPRICVKMLAISALDDEGHRFAPADAERRETAALVLVLHRVEQGHEDARAGCADRVAEAHRAAADVHLRGIESELAVVRDSDDRESLVDLVEIDIAG